MSNASVNWSVVPGFNAPGTVLSQGREYPLLEREDFLKMHGDTVAVAYNWHLKLFSIRDKPGGKVKGYTREVSLAWVDFAVDTAKAAKVYAGGHKNLHAYVVGEINCSDMDDTFGPWKWALRYNPKDVPWFTTPANGEKCTGATAVKLWVEDGKARMAAYLPVR
jgi:hypothetical protein